MLSRFIVASHTRSKTSSLAFNGTSQDRLLCMGAVAGIPDLAVYAFDPAKDVFYRTPEQLAPEDLEHEVAIHFPQSLRSSLHSRIFASTMGSAVLLQCVPQGAPVLSPLSALSGLLDRIGGVNSAILQADNGGLTLIRRAGDDVTVHFSARPVEEFLSLDPGSRAIEFPDYDALEIILCGSDITQNSLDQLRRDRVGVVRMLAPGDLLDSLSLSEELPSGHSDISAISLALGAGIVYRDIALVTGKS